MPRAVALATLAAMTLGCRLVLEADPGVPAEDGGSGGFTLGLTDDLPHPLPSSGPYAYATFRPDASDFLAVGQSYVDPVFGTQLRRLSDHFPQEPFGNQPYACNGFANADGSLVFAVGELRSSATGAVVYSGTPAAGGYGQSFDPLDPDVYYYAQGTRLMQYRLSTGADISLHDFGAALSDLGGSVDWIDRTGRYLLVNVAGSIRVYDKDEDSVFTGAVPGGSLNGGWVGISPDARWLVVGGDFDQRAFRIDLAAKTLAASGHTFWTLCGDQGDLVSASDGKTYMMTAECYEHPDVYAVDVSLAQSGDDATGRQKQRDDNRKLFSIQWDVGVHFSGISRGPLSDWAVVSTEVASNDPSGSWAPYRGELVAVNAVTAEVRRLAHHRSDVGLYCTQPRVLAAWDGSGVFFVSNFGVTRGESCGYSDMYYLPLR